MRRYLKNLKSTVHSMGGWR